MTTSNPPSHQGAPPPAPAQVKSKLRLLRGAAKRPSANAISSIVVSRMRAAMSLPLAISSGAALVNNLAAWRLDRLECEPPPRQARSVSPVTRSMLSTGTASKAETTCAKLGLVTLAVCLIAAVALGANRVSVGHHLPIDQVLAAQFDPIEPTLSGGRINQPLDRIGHFGTARAAVGVGRHRVSEHRARAQTRRRDVVGTGDQRRPLAERRPRNTGSADIADIVGPQRPKSVRRSVMPAPPWSPDRAPESRLGTLLSESRCT